jgi:dihydroorotate dehydrogenase
MFRLEPELAHACTLAALKGCSPLGVLRLLRPPVPAVPCRVMGIEFPNPVGLAAGVDKNGDYLDGLAAIGFGFIELGTVTPRPQPGNPKPRLFRLTQAQALINRMGFNNKGVDYLVERVQQARYRGVLGINIGKNFDTPLEHATEDYLIGMRKVYGLASYIVINVSSPNTVGLRDLQHGELLDELLEAVKAEQKLLSVRHGRYVPLVIKIAPDMSDAELDVVADRILVHRIDGVAATNTTLSRAGVHGLRHAEEGGGLSGKPLRQRSTEIVRLLHQRLQGRIPIIGVGGIADAAAALEKLHSGASLVQVYTGLVYRGPGLVSEVVRALHEQRLRAGIASLA